MTRRALVTAAAVALAILVGSQPAHAQSRYDFNVPFSFVANGKTLSAGQYSIAPNESQDVLTLESRNTKGGTVVLPVETRTAGGRIGSMTEPEVVFDKINGQLYVSELLVPGEDGYVMLVTKAKHTHQSLKGARAKK